MQQYVGVKEIKRNIAANNILLFSPFPFATRLAGFLFVDRDTHAFFSCTAKKIK